MPLIRDLLLAHPAGLTEAQLLAAGREKQPWLSARQVQGELKDLEAELEIDGDRYRIKTEPKVEPAARRTGPLRCIAVDLETVVRLTEDKPDGDRMPFQIGAVRFGGDREWVAAETTFERFIKMPEPWEARLEREAIKQRYLQGAVPPAEAWSDFLDFIAETDVLVAYNGLKLDFPVIDQALSDLGLELPKDVGRIDGYLLALSVWPVPPRQHRLFDLVRRHKTDRLDIDLDGLQAHDALDDSRVLVHLMRLAAYTVNRWSPEMKTLLAAVTRNSPAWQFLFGLLKRPPQAREVDMATVRDTVATTLAAKPALRPPLESEAPPVEPLDPTALMRDGKVDINELVREVKRVEGAEAEARQSQIEMADRMREWIAERRSALVEAPTGTGKSYAILAVALDWLAADSRNRVVISTFTKQLQNQLATDIDALHRTGKVPGLMTTAALIKGAANRLSLRGLIRILADLAAGDDGREQRGEFLGDPKLAELVVYLTVRLISLGTHVEEWESHSVDSVDIEPFWDGYLENRRSLYLRLLSQARAGDYDAKDDVPIARHTTETKEDLARNRLVVANHALLLHHLEDFPDAPRTLLIVDEAHSLESAATDSLSSHFHYQLLEQGVRELREWMRPPAGGEEQTQENYRQLQDAVGQLENYLSITRLPMTAQASFDTVGRDPLHRDALRSVTVASPLDSTGIERRAVFAEAVRETAGRVRRVTGLLKMQPSRTDRIEEDRRWTLLRSFDDLDRSLGRIRDDLDAIAEAGPADTPGNRVVWADEQSTPQRNKRFYAFGVTSSPIEIGREPNYRQFLDGFAQIFFVSATLRVSGEWTYICERLGLDADEVGTHDLPTPFDVARQAKLVCFTDFPSWAEQESVALESVAQQVHGFLREVSHDGENGVMVLTTSRRAAAGVADRLLRMRAELEEPYAVASAPLSGNARAVDYFKSQGGVVVGTKGLWQGVDIAEPNHLRMVWINKIPFAPFGDPVTTARRELIRQRAEEKGDPDPDGTAMQRFYLPMAAMDLRQGVGRLIRSRNHRGVVVISDRKLGQPGRLNAIYRRVFLGSMDPGLVTDANGTFAGGNLYSMRDGWRAIWEFFADLLPAKRLAELTTEAALDEHTLLPSVLKIRRAELTTKEIENGGPAIVLERTRDVGRLLIDNPEIDLHEYQREAIGAIAEGRDVLVNLPTSWGKSFIFQLPALALPGVTIVISPLVSLMTDQALALNRSIGGAVRALVAPMRESNSRTGKAEVQEQLKGEDQRIKIIYLSPERLCQAQFQDWIRTGVERGVVRRIAVDEAHTFVTWGEDFRPSFKRAEAFLSELRQMENRPQLMALTATATPTVRRGLRRAIFGLDGADPDRLTEIRRNPIRTDLALYRKSLGGPIAVQRMVESLVEEAGKQHTIVYALTIKEARRIHNALLEHLGESSRDRVRLYHGRLSPSEKELVANEFSKQVDPDEQPLPMIVVATSAFGLGVDRKDVRTVIVASPPADLAALYQQVGRGGRDGNGATGIMLATNSAFSTLAFMTSQKLRAELVPVIAGEIIDSAPVVDTRAIAEKVVRLEGEAGRLRPEEVNDSDTVERHRAWVTRVLAEMDLDGTLDDLGDFPETVAVVSRDDREVSSEMAGVMLVVAAAIDNPAHVDVVSFAQRAASVLPGGEPDPTRAWAFLLDLHQVGAADVSQRPNERTLTAIRLKRTTISGSLISRMVESRTADEIRAVADFFNAKDCVNDHFRGYFDEPTLPDGTCVLHPCSTCLDGQAVQELPELFGRLSTPVTGKARREGNADPERAGMRRSAGRQAMRVLRYRRKGIGRLQLLKLLDGEDGYWTKEAGWVPLPMELIENDAFGKLPGLKMGDLDDVLDEFIAQGIVVKNDYNRYQLGTHAAQFAEWAARKAAEAAS